MTLAQLLRANRGGCDSHSRRRGLKDMHRDTPAQLQLPQIIPHVPVKPQSPVSEPLEKGNRVTHMSTICLS